RFPRLSSRPRRQISRPDKAPPLSEPQLRTCAASWRSLTRSELEDATSSSSTTCARPGASSTRSPTVCSSTAALLVSAAWSWREGSGDGVSSHDSGSERRVPRRVEEQQRHEDGQIVDFTGETELHALRLVAWRACCRNNHAGTSVGYSAEV